MICFSIVFCNDPNLLLTDIVLGFSFRAFPQRFKTCMLGKGFHTLTKGVSFSSRTNVGFSQSTSLQGSAFSLTLVPFSNRCGIPPNPPPSRPASLLAHCLVSTPIREQTPHWHIVWSLALIPFVTAQAYCYQILSSLGFPFQASPQGFKTRLLGKGVSFSSSSNVGFSHVCSISPIFDHCFYQ